MQPGLHRDLSLWKQCHIRTPCISTHTHARTPTRTHTHTQHCMQPECGNQMTYTPKVSHTHGGLRLTIGLRGADREPHLLYNPSTTWEPTGAKPASYWFRDDKGWSFRTNGTETGPRSRWATQLLPSQLWPWRISALCDAAATPLRPALLASASPAPIIIWSKCSATGVPDHMASQRSHPEGKGVGEELTLMNPLMKRLYLETVLTSDA